MRCMYISMCGMCVCMSAHVCEHIPLFSAHEYGDRHMFMAMHLCTWMHAPEHVCYMQGVGGHDWYVCICVSMCLCVSVGVVCGWLDMASTLCPSLAWASPSHVDVNGSLGSGASALGLSCLAGWLCSKGAGSVEAGTTELGCSLESQGAPGNPGNCVFKRKPIYVNVGLLVPVL